MSRRNAFVLNPRPRHDSLALFLRHFLADPRRTGSAIPSSRFLVGRMMKQVDFATARVMVEFGPGLGCMTREILARAAPSAVVISIDNNPAFARALRRRFTDPRLHVCLASVTELQAVLARLGIRKVDCIISSLPFANMPEAVRDQILHASASVLRDGARFVAFQYRRVLLPALRDRFAHVQREYEPLNLPPAHVFCCTKRDD
ncbi:MAG: methyltransferase domain-containing protein [Terriglobales bacterium]